MVVLESAGERAQGMVMDLKTFERDLTFHGRIGEIARQIGGHGSLPVQLGKTHRCCDLVEPLCIEMGRKLDGLIRVDAPANSQGGLGSFKIGLVDFPQTLGGMKTKSALLDCRKKS